MAVEATTKLGLLNCPLTEMLHTVTLVINTGEAGIAEIVHGTAESAEAETTTVNRHTRTDRPRIGSKSDRWSWNCYCECGCSEVTCGALNLHSIGARRGRRGYYETGTTRSPTD